MSQVCFSCGGEFEVRDGPTHDYMLSSAGCWMAYGELLTREYENPVLFSAVHRLTVDAYALQHPGDPHDRRAVQSVWVHYAALHLAFEEQMPPASIRAVMQKLTNRSFPSLPPAPSDFSITIADVLAGSEDNHISAVEAWAKAAYSAWDPLNEDARRLLAAV